LTSKIVFCPFSSPGFEEGQKYAEKIVAKHKEVLESITELCVSLTELEEKLKQGDILKTNVNLEDFHDDFIDLLKEPARNKQTLFNEERNKVKSMSRSTAIIQSPGSKYHYANWLFCGMVLKHLSPDSTLRQRKVAKP